jgi:hypothetical protein
MKNINVKKVVAGAAALALGVGVLGVAIAGNNSGDTFGPVVKGDVYTTSTMQPKVSIVTGVNGDDDQWAQNIANAIATSAKKRNPQYDAWVPSGGSTTVTGDGKEFKKNELGTSANLFKLDHKDYPGLGDYKVKVNTKEFGTTEIKVKDFLMVEDVYPAFDPDEDVKDLTTVIDSGNLKYRIEFTPGIKNGATDDGSPDFKFKIMGKEYTVEDWNGVEEKLILVQNKTGIPYVEGDTFSIDGHTVEVVQILDSGADEPYEIELALKDASGNLVDRAIYGADDEIFTEHIDVSATVSKVYKNKVYIVAGTSPKLILENGLIEDFPNADDDLWKVELGVNSTTHALDFIEISNDDPDVTWKNEDALRIGDAASYPFDFAKVKFVGLTEEDSKTVTVEDGYIKYTDDDDEDHEIFFFDRTTGTNGIERYTTRKTIDGKKLYFEFNGTDQNFTVRLNDKDGDYLQDNGSWGNTVHKFVTADGDVTPIKIATYNNDDEIIKYGVYTDDNTTITELVIGLVTTAGGNISTGQKWEIADIYEDVDGAVKAADRTLVGENSATYEYADAALKSMFEFKVTDDSGSVIAYIDAYTGDLVNTSSSKYNGGKRQVESLAPASFPDLDQEDTDDLRWAYTTFGTKYEVDGGLFKATLPEDRIYAKIFVGGGTTVIDDSDETNPYPKYITTNVVANDLLKKDTPMEVSGTLIVVGGHLVNTAAVGYTNAPLTQEGDYIMGKHANSNIYVAGWTKADTGTAASELINVITSWPIE